MVTVREITKFRKKIWDYYRRNKRDFPWRSTHDPYRVMVSEVMLQQTQAGRVESKYKEFLKKFPTVSALAASTTREVLNAWQGLGYNRRALYLHKAAKIIGEKHKGVFPKTLEELKLLPGIGTNTAGATLAFSYNMPVVFIETNIRSVYIHYFYSKQNKVADKDLLRLIEVTLDKKNPREWYHALMDYGVCLKKLHKNPSRRSSHYLKQSPFEGSTRQLRGQVLKQLLNKKSLSVSTLTKNLAMNEKKLFLILKNLEQEGFLIIKDNKVIDL